MMSKDIVEADADKNDIYSSDMSWKLSIGLGMVRYLSSWYE